MSYALGQAKWIPGQISFMTTRTGTLPTPQKLIEAGLPYAPYIEHGSYITGQPDIARYGRDPYRGLSGPIGYLSQVPDTTAVQQDVERRADEVQQSVTQAGQEAVRSVAKASILVGLGAAVGGAAGLAGGLLGKPFWSTLLGAAGGGALGYLAYDRLKDV